MKVQIRKYYVLWHATCGHRDCRWEVFAFEWDYAIFRAQWHWMSHQP